MDLESEAAQRVGTTLCNKWTLERLIGTGGMAAVYVANHKIGRREAIKILHSDVAKDPDLRARFEQEAHAVNRFKHPGTVEVRDIDVAEDGSPFLVMELLEGQSLAELARQPGGVALPELLRMVDELLDVLAAAHAQGIIHRDIKPDNLFVLTDGRLKVLDFGIARVRAGAPLKLRTRVGATLGTAPYMPPEQIHGLEIDPRAALFSVGATMFRLIARRRIHEAESEAETLVKMAKEPAPPLASVAPEVPEGVALVVDRALEFDREHRYPDALTMQSDVRALREGRPPPYATARRDDSAAGLPPSTASFVAARAPSSAPRTEPASGPKTDLDRTSAASPGAIQTASAAARDSAGLPVQPVTSDAVTVNRSPPDPSVDPTTRPAMMMPPAMGAPPASTLPAPSPSLEMPAPQQPSAERTLRSVQNLEGAGVPAPQGYVMVTTVMPQVPAPRASPYDSDPPSSGPSRPRGPRTQLSGVAPSLPLAPGESIAVLAAPARRLTLPGTEVAVLPLVLVGVVFAALGVGLTLWLMLRDASPDDPIGTPAATTSSAREPGQPSIGPRAMRPNDLGLPGPGHSPGLTTQTPPAKQAPVKSPHKGP
jgi:eukaryotic-like serine/threonine-protein kinase